jgi:adenine-specific DNA-methyltransferase
VFNRKRAAPAALESLLRRTRATTVVVSANDESWMAPEAVVAALEAAGHERVEVLAFDSRRYVGATIGVHGPTGERVGSVGRLRNVEYLFVAGPADLVQRVNSTHSG